MLNAIRDYHIGIPLTYSQYPLCGVRVFTAGMAGEGAGDEVSRSLANKAFIN